MRPAWAANEHDHNFHSRKMILWEMISLFGLLFKRRDAIIKIAIYKFSREGMRRVLIPLYAKKAQMCRIM